MSCARPTAPTTSRDLPGWRTSSWRSSTRSPGSPPHAPSSAAGGPRSPRRRCAASPQVDLPPAVEQGSVATTPSLSNRRPAPPPRRLDAPGDASRSARPPGRAGAGAPGGRGPRRRTPRRAPRRGSRPPEGEVRGTHPSRMRPASTITSAETSTASTSPGATRAARSAVSVRGRSRRRGAHPRRRWGGGTRPSSPRSASDGSGDRFMVPVGVGVIGLAHPPAIISDGVRDTRFGTVVRLPGLNVSRPAAPR